MLPGTTCSRLQPDLRAGPQLYRGQRAKARRHGAGAAARARRVPAWPTPYILEEPVMLTKDTELEVVAYQDTPKVHRRQRRRR